MNKIEVETSCQRRPLLWNERQLTCNAYQGKTLESVLKARLERACYRGSGMAQLKTILQKCAAN